LLLIIDRKLHIGFQITKKSSTLDYLVVHWQPVWWAILAIAGLLITIMNTPFIF